MHRVKPDWGLLYLNDETAQYAVHMLTLVKVTMCTKSFHQQPADNINLQFIQLFQRELSFWHGLCHPPLIQSGSPPLSSQVPHLWVVRTYGSLWFPTSGSVRFPTPLVSWANLAHLSITREWTCHYHRHKSRIQENAGRQLRHHKNS